MDYCHASEWAVYRYVVEQNRKRDDRDIPVGEEGERDEEEGNPQPNIVHCTLRYISGASTRVATSRQSTESTFSCQFYREMCFNILFEVFRKKIIIN